MKEEFSHAIFFLISQKTYFFLFTKCLRFQLLLIIYADHSEKTIIKDKKTVHTTKNSSQPFQLFTASPLFAYFLLLNSIVFFDRGPRCEWNDESWNQVANEFLGGAIVGCVFYPHVFLRGFFYVLLQAPKWERKKYIWIIFLQERVILSRRID